MIPVRRVEKPPEFDTRAGEPGNQWLLDNPGSTRRPPAYWREFTLQLAAGFGHLCGYMCLWTTDGTVDHFVSVDEDWSKAYDWGNYRYAAGWVNSSKQNVTAAEILDPYEVGEGWFEVLLPTLELVVSDRIPVDKRKLAEQTLKKLPIGRDWRAIKRRAIYYDEYANGLIKLDELRRRAPLVAAAIIKAQSRASK